MTIFNSYVKLPEGNDGIPVQVPGKVRFSGYRNDFGHSRPGEKKLIANERGAPKMNRFENKSQKYNGNSGFSH